MSVAVNAVLRYQILDSGSSSRIIAYWIKTVVNEFLDIVIVGSIPGSGSVDTNKMESSRAKIEQY